MINKKIIRKNLQNQRSLLSLSEVSSSSQKISDKVIKELFLQINNLEKKKIALYLSSNNEVETKSILEYLTLKIKNPNIALPKINTKNHLIEFVKYEGGEELISNFKYPNILEPKSARAIIPEIIFVPLLACDLNGNRIGRGAGYYDRTICALKKNTPNIVVIGLAYNFQILDKIEAEEFDQKLDLIICEDKIINCHDQLQ